MRNKKLFYLAYGSLVLTVVSMSEIIASETDVGMRRRSDAMSLKDRKKLEPPYQETLTLKFSHTNHQIQLPDSNKKERDCSKEITARILKESANPRTRPFKKEEEKVKEEGTISKFEQDYISNLPAGPISTQESASKAHAQCMEKAITK